MGLDLSRRIDIVIDRLADSNWKLEPLYAVEGSYNGTTLRVQLTNAGIVEPQTANLLFGFRCAENANEGVYPFDVVDSDKGIYEVSYPSEMLSVPGRVVCAISVTESGDDGVTRIMKTQNFDVRVEKSVISSDMEVAENSITVFQKMLIDISDHERRIVYVEMNFKHIADMLSLNIPNMDVAVSSRASESGQTAMSEVLNTIVVEMTLGKRKGLSQSFSTPGTYTFSVPNDTGVLYVTAVGAGGGGGGGGGRYKTSNSSSGSYYPGIGGGGGGGGGLAESVLSVMPGEKITVQVGGGGSGGKGGRSVSPAGYNGPDSTRGDRGTTGGASRVGNNILATGGGGGGGGGGRMGDVTDPGVGGTGGLLGGNTGSTGEIPEGTSDLGGAGGGGGAGKLVGSSFFGKGGAGGAGADSATASTPGTGSSGSSGYVLIEW